MLPEFALVNGRIDPSWIEQFEAYRFQSTEVPGFILETLPLLVDTLGGEGFQQELPCQDGEARRKLVVITPPPQKSFGNILRIILQDLWLSKSFAGIDKQGRWTFEVPCPDRTENPLSSRERAAGAD